MTSPSPQDRRLLLLSGFMGVGKSTVGRAVAARVGASFEDLDDAIETETGHFIPRLFADGGEVGFRAIERAVLSDRLNATTDAARVIALGGGALIDPDSLRDALRRAFVVTLLADVDTIVARCAGSDRPLLADAEGQAVERVRRLLEARAPIYRAGHLHLATDRETPEALAKQLAELWTGA